MAGANRLHLDFKLNTTEERNAFLQQYLLRPEFTERPPTEDELETMANYLLWGKNPVTGLNVKQEGLIDIETKHSTWNRHNEVESLEGLMEQPAFNEASVSSIADSAPVKIKKEVFSRKDALANCPASLRNDFLELFHRIDRTELMINLYELAHGRREKPPRDQLLSKFTEEEQEAMREKVSHWNQYRYLKMRHELVEMRQEQYSLRDAFQAPMAPAAPSPDSAIEPAAFGMEIEVLPLGLMDGYAARGLVFRKWEEIIPANYTEENLQIISDLYWQKKSYKPGSQQHYFDFRELEHVYQIFQLFFELKDEAEDAKMQLGSTLPALIDTLNFYVEQAELTELQREILDMKLRKVKNVDIALEINKKWKKSYTPNYISTIFRQHIIPKINEAAAYHEKIIGNVFFEEEFKVCTGCGKTLLRDASNFTRRSRSKDGFTSKCKICEKNARLGASNAADLAEA